MIMGLGKTYKDFDNEVVSQTVNLPITLYTQEKAIELGLMQEDKTTKYIIGAIVVIILWIIYHSIKKRRRLKRSMQNNGR